MKYPNTLLVRYYGLYEIKSENKKRYDAFVIMGNCFETDKTIHEIYDLKGSTYGRENKGLGVKKDLDFIKSNLRIKLGPQRKRFLEQLTIDVQVKFVV